LLHIKNEAHNLNLFCLPYFLAAGIKEYISEKVTSPKPFNKRLYRLISRSCRSISASLYLSIFLPHLVKQIS